MQNLTRGRMVAILTLVLSLFAMVQLAKLNAPPPEVRAQAAADRADRAAWDARQEMRHESAMAQCAEAVRFGSRKAKLGWPAAGAMPGGDILVRQPVTLAGETRTVRCVLRNSGSFELVGIE